MTGGPADLELVADADEAQFAGLLLPVLAAVGVLEELADKLVFGLAHQAFQGHVQGVVVLLHKASLPRHVSNVSLVGSLRAPWNHKATTCDDGRCCSHEAAGIIGGDVRREGITVS